MCNINSVALVETISQRAYGIGLGLGYYLDSTGPLAPELRDRSLLKPAEVNLQLSRVAAGVCVRPYFLFQFRVDGHPVKF